MQPSELQQNARYEATLRLGAVEGQFATKAIVTEKLKGLGFTFVQVNGSGRDWTATGVWPLPNQKMPRLDERIKSVRKI